MKKNYLATLGLVIFSVQAIALETISGKVTILEPSYMPSSITFQLDNGNSTCPTGTWLKWQKSEIDNNKAVYSSLLAAQARGKKVNFIFDDGDTSCVGKFLHLTND